jgi:3-deoxy-7-phosphoheptulonate synthase
MNSPSDFPEVARTGGLTKSARVGDTDIGKEIFALVAGPCAVESEEQIEAAAALVAASNTRLFRGGAFKPRTSPYTFPGLGLDGLRLMRDAADRHGLALVTEVPSTQRVDDVAEIADALQIGARSMQNFDLLRVAAGTGRPIFLKRGFGATLREWILAAEHLAVHGATEIVLVERGIRTFETELRFTLDLAGALFGQRETRLPVMIDPSHATGDPRLVPPLVRAALASGLDGAMVEVHPDPSRALCDGPQALTPEAFGHLTSSLASLAQAHP